MDDMTICLKLYPDCEGLDSAFSKMAFKFFQKGMRYREENPVKPFELGSEGSNSLD
jgi:hypothetical protein